jgi:hypothetical protein
MGYKYHFVFYAHVDEGIIGESEPTETFELGYTGESSPSSPSLSPSLPPSSLSSCSFHIAVAAIVPTVVLLIVIVVLLGVNSKLSRRIGKLQAETQDPVDIKTTPMHTSSAYGLTGIQLWLLLSVSLPSSVFDHSSRNCQIS